MVPVADLDPSVYASTPNLDVPGQIALGRQLIAAAPADLPAPAEICRKDLLTKTRALEAGYEETQDDGSTQDNRVIDRGDDGSWAAVYGRLNCYNSLDEERLPPVGRAKALASRLFPSGLTFTQLEYGAQWAEANWRINVIAKENLEPELRELCGDLFVDELFYWHKKYGKMVGTVATGKTRRGAKAKERPNLAELRRQAMQAVVAWQIQLVALHLAGQLDARPALRPTDLYRDKLASGPKAAPVPKAPSSPAPEPTPATEPGQTPAT